MRRAIVVFHGHGLGRWRRFLKPGFAHCFVAVENDGYWILFDPKAGCTELRVLAGVDIDLTGFYREQGFTAVETDIRHTTPKSPLMPATCVAAVKRLIGLRAPLVITPWQLYGRLVATGDRQKEA